MEDQKLEVAADPRQMLRPTGGRDELNLAEFPITLLCDRVPKGCKTLVFEIESRGPLGSPKVPRKVTITGSDAYGLPTAVDDEILVALIQLTKLKSDFTNPVVAFTRYEILRLLGWPDDGRSYRRIEESIRRWTGVTLYYDNAWRDNATGTWVSENFHVIERSSLVDAETKRVRKARGQGELALSSFRWSEVVFQNFQAGSLKRLDIDAYFSYASSVAKRMYRFLDKRFWIKDRWEFDLKEFAFNHIGLSSNYNVAQIKNKLGPALEELSRSTDERAAFLEPLEPGKRYVKLSKGQWLIVVGRQLPCPAAPGNAPPVEQPEGLVAELVGRGVAHPVAEELVAANPPEFIAHRIEVFDWIVERKGQKIIKESPTGYLVTSIRDRYLTVPKGFVPRAERTRREAAEREEQARKDEARLREKAERARLEAEHERVRDYLQRLNAEEQEAVDARALDDAPEHVAAEYRGTPRSQRPLASLRMRLIRDAYIRKLVGLEPEPA